MDLLYLAKRRLVLSLVSAFFLCLVEAAASAVAAEVPPAHQPSGGEAAQPAQSQWAHVCQAVAGEVAQKQRPSEKSKLDSPLFEGLQIETSDMKLYESFFETILRVPVIQRMDHPQMDSLRGYCYRGVLIVVRQDLRTQRPTGWVQLNFVVPDVAAIQEELERAYQASPVSKREESERNKIVRFQLKLDVSRGNCRATRLEVGGPEGFMIGFDQFKEGSCKTDEKQKQRESPEHDTQHQ